MNPTNDVLEKRVAALEGGLSCVTVSSGQTASTFAVLNVAQAGDNIVCSNSRSITRDKYFNFNACRMCCNVYSYGNFR